MANKNNQADATVKVSSDNVVCDENGKPYKVHLCKTDVSQNSNKFYDMELLEKTGRLKYAVQLINGRIGYKGVTNTKEFGDMEKAKSFFEKKFQDKTHLEWEERGDEPVPGKYVVVELIRDKKAGVEKEKTEDKHEKENEKNLENVQETKRNRKRTVAKQEKEVFKLLEKVRELLKCICDEDVHLNLLKQLKFNEEYGKPIDCLSLSQLDLGYDILMEIEKVIAPSVRETRGRGRKKTGEEKKTGSTVHDTNRYYSLIPHAFGFSVPPKIDTLGKVQLERELLDALKGTLDAAQSVQDCKKEGKKDIYESLFDRLPCDLQPVDGKTGEIIKECLSFRAPSHMFNMEMVEAFEVKKKNAPKIKRARQANKRLLLWHGTRVTNVFSVLMNGLDVPKGPRGDLMFGNGVYFANVPSKSANYCKPEAGTRTFMLLCEVLVEDPLILHASEIAAEQKMMEGGHGCVLAAGRLTPRESIKLDGVTIYKGGLEEAEAESELMYDEYVVYDNEKFDVKYLVEVEMRRLTMEEMMAQRVL